MAMELRSITDTMTKIMTDTDDHNKNVVQNLDAQIKKMTRTIKTMKTWKRKLTKQNRRLKRKTTKQDEQITELQTEIKQLTTVIMDLQTENMDLNDDEDELLTKNVYLTIDLEHSEDDIRTLTERLDNNSCPYCSSPTPSTSSTSAQTTVNKHEILFW